MFVLAIKDLRLFLKDRKAIFLTFLLPVALITLFALAYGGIIGKSDPQPERLLVCDADSSALSQDLIGRLKEVEGMTLEAVDTFTAGESIRKGQRLALVYVGEGFNDSLNQGGPLPLFLWYDAAKEMEASLLQEVVLSRIAPEITRMQNQQRIRAYLTQRFAVMGPDSIASIGRDLEGYMSGESGGSLVRPVPVSGRQEVNFGLIQAVAGVAVMMLLFSVTAIGGSILGEKESGTLRRLLASPLKPRSILGGKMLYALIIALFQLTIMFLYSWLAFGLDIWVDPLALGLTILGTALACSSFGIFLAAISRTRRQLEGMSTILILIMSALGGSMIPLFFMPRFMQDLAVVSVNYWSIQAFFDIFARDTGLLPILVKVGVLAGIALSLMILSIHFFGKNILRHR